MKTKLLCITFILTLIISCKDSAKKNLSFAGKQNLYDSIENKNLRLLDSVGLRRFDDSARWRLYTFHCDDTAVANDNKYFPVSSLKLKLGFAAKTNDTLDLLYFFMQNDTTTINKQLKNGSYITDGVQFSIPENKVIAFIAGEGILTISGLNSRFQNPLQPEVILYIIKNQQRLTGWFRDEAKKRQVLH